MLLPRHASPLLFSGRHAAVLEVERHMVIQLSRLHMQLDELGSVQCTAWALIRVSLTYARAVLTSRRTKCHRSCCCLLLVIHLHVIRHFSKRGEGVVMVFELATASMLPTGRSLCFKCVVLYPGPHTGSHRILFALRGQLLGQLLLASHLSWHVCSVVILLG